MKTKIKLEELKIKSFITKVNSHRVRGGVSGGSDCIPCSTGCTGSGGADSLADCAM